MLFGRSSTTVSVAILCGAIGLARAQAPASSAAIPATAPTASAPAAAAVDTASNVVQPAIAKLQFALSILTAEKWKMPKAVREATAANVASIRRDVETTLPPLMTAADAAPGSVSTMLPLSRNLSALYDVLLRVTVIAESTAPQEQTAALQQSMTSLEGARRTLSDSLQSVAEAQEAQTKSLQKQLSARPVAVAATATPAPCKPATPATHTTKKKAAAKPAAPAK